MSDAIKRLELHDGAVFMLEYDSHNESPREWNNLGTFWTWEQRHSSPDENPYKDQQDFDVNEIEKIALVLPVYKYEHSGVIYNTGGFSDPWDSGQVGYIFVTKGDVRKEYGVTRISKQLAQKVYAVLESEVNTYSKWANGDIFYFYIADKDGNEIGGCGGFYNEKDILEYVPDEYRNEIKEAL